MPSIAALLNEKTAGIGQSPVTERKHSVFSSISADKQNVAMSGT